MTSQFNYPRFTPSEGNLTLLIQKEYINNSIKNGNLPNDSFTNNKITDLIASNNPDDKIYFWQLYSIIGEKPVSNLIRKFYENIFNDEESWFKDEFVDLGDIDYHVDGQLRFWLDVMGGGKHYQGGEKKLHLKHKIVKNIMTTRGANRWMKHMKDALTIFNNIINLDKRIVGCIDEFLHYFMTKYSIEFDFNVFEVTRLHSKL